MGIGMNRNRFCWPRCLLPVSYTHLDVYKRQVQEHYHLYYICALLAGIMDTLDGFAAKRLNQYSELGEQLDSLCDGINFVLVPAVFAVTRMDMRLGTMICAGIYCACGILRLRCV